MVYIQTKVSIPFININIVNPKNGFFFGKFDSCVFWLCGVWWELSDGYYVDWALPCGWRSLFVCGVLIFLPKEECMSNGFYFVWWDLWDGLLPCEFLWVFVSFDFQPKELHGTIHLTSCEHSRRVSLHSMRLCTLSAPMRVVGIARKSTRANCENSFMNGLKISIIPSWLLFLQGAPHFQTSSHSHFLNCKAFHSWNT